MSGNIEDLKILTTTATRPIQSNRRLSLHCTSSASNKASDLLGGTFRKCKSLPYCVDFYAHVAVKPSNAHERKKVFSNRPKILRKTWDRVKGIINSPSSSGGGAAAVGGSSGCVRGNGDVVRRGNGSSSAPSTPLRSETFFGDSGGGGDERDRIARNYALLQKRLSQEFRQSSLKKSSGAGEFSDEFKRKLFEWESHPSRRNKGSKDCASVLSSRHLKELAWLDKQLEKIEAEKKRLEEELKKQVEREIRVQKMKEAIRCSVNERVYNIRTESGVKVRVEGITSEYAMKVYEWEEKRGIGVEMSALGYFDPKYRDDEDDRTEEHGIEMKVTTTEDETLEDEAIIGPLDLINARLIKKLEESEGQPGLGERGEQLLAECVALGKVASGACSSSSGGAIGGEVDGRVSSTASSCCCSAEYEYEHTDSFATKNNSGASNTDSDVYEKRCTITRRRSSECVSTPDRGSPGLSAFTSEDEEVVKEDEEKKPEDEGGDEEDKARDVVVPLCVKQIVIDEDSTAHGDSNVFVQTKRTIFSPVVEVNASAACDAGGGARIVGAIPKRPVAYKPQPKTQLHRVFPPLACPCPPYCSPMTSRKFNNPGGGGAATPGEEFSIDRFLSDRGIGRKLPPRTNAHLARKYTIGGGFPPPLGRGCIIARSSSFNAHEDVRCGGGDDDDGLRDDVRAVGFSESRDGAFGGVSKSKSTGSIKRSIANVKCFLGFGGGNSSKGEQRGSTTGIGESSSQLGDQQYFNERRGSKSGGGFVRRLGAALWRGGNNNSKGEQQQQPGGGGGGVE